MQAFQEKQSIQLIKDMGARVTFFMRFDLILCLCESEYVYACIVVVVVDSLVLKAEHSRDYCVLGRYAENCHFFF